MSRNTRRSLSLPARMAAAGVDRVFVAEAATLALGYGSQRLTNSQLWSDNLALRTRADLSDALLREAVEALGKLHHAVCGDTGFAHCVRLDSGMAYPWPALDDADEIARATLAKLRAHLEGEKE